MIKFQIKIIVDKKGFKKRSQPLKGFLSRAVSTLGIILSVLVLSTIIGLGIHLVFAWTSPTADPPGNNVAAPINVSSTTQTKSGDIRLEDLHLNATGNEGSIYNADIVQGYNDLRLWGNSARNATVWIDSPATITQDLTVNGMIQASQFRSTGNRLIVRAANQTTTGYLDFNGDSTAIGVPQNSGYLRIFEYGSWDELLRVEATGKVQADSGFHVDGYEMVGSNADMLYANRRNTPGGGIWVSDDGGFYDYNNAYIDFRGDAGIRVLEWNGSWGDNSIRAAKLCIQNDCRDTWPSGDGGITCADCDSRFVNQWENWGGNLTVAGDITAEGVAAISFRSTTNRLIVRAASTVTTGYLDFNGNSTAIGVPQNTGYLNVFEYGSWDSLLRVDADGDVIIGGTIRGYSDLVLDDSISVGGSIYADYQIRSETDVVANNNLFAGNDLTVDGHINAPNQGWEDTTTATRNVTPNTVYLTCNEGWYLYKVQVSKDGRSSRGWCASPFKKAPVSPPGGWGSPCFTGKTPILMADATYKNIADVQPGEYILTRESENSLKLVKAKVLSTYEHWVDRYYVINGYLEVTSYHRMLVNGKWKAVKDIKIGDKLLNKDNQEIVVESMEQKIKGQEFQVYNLEIEKYQTYFAGGFYVHNRKLDPIYR